MIKPKALVFGSPFEGRTSYFLAGLSHFYELEIYFVPNKRFRFAWQVFYKWQYSKDAKFIQCSDINQVKSLSKNYDSAFIFEEAVHEFLPWFEKQDEILSFLQAVKLKVQKIFWLEIGEQQWFTFGRAEFWDMITGVIKGQVFKPEYIYLLKDLNKISLFQGKELVLYPNLVKENLMFDMEKYRAKIFPFPFTPTITDLAKYNWQNHSRIYDWSANTRTVGNGLLRYDIIKTLENKLNKKYFYSIEYHNLQHSTNLPEKQNFFNPYLIPKIGKYLFKLNYGKYFYAQPLYLHNLLNSKCYLGLGWSFSSLRTADAWGAGTLLINFSFKKCDYGIPVEDGYNYISLGERDEMTTDNINFDLKYENQVVAKMEAILSDPKKQQEIIKNQLATYNEYFRTPQQFAKKIFIDKIK